MKTKHLDFSTEIKALSNRQFEAYAATFGNVDHHDDIIVKGAFLDSLTKRMPKLAYQHNTNLLPGKITNAVEDSKGLLVTGEFINTPIGDQAYEEVKTGVINQMSIGFSASEVDFKDDIRLLKKIELFEVSFVTFPANEQAVVTDVKDIADIRDFEKFLRNSGFSKERAVAIASAGFKTKGTGSDSEANSRNTERDAEVEEVISLITTLTNQLKGVKDGRKLTGDQESH
jgi:uncharacterized protein